MSGPVVPERYPDNILVSARPGIVAPVGSGPAAEWQAWWQRHADVADDPLRSAARQGFVLTPPEFAALGATRARTRNEVRQGRWTAAGYGAVAPLDIRETSTHYDARMRLTRRRHALCCAGAAKRRASAVVSGRSAAALHGLPTLWLPRAPELTESDVGQGRRGTAHVYAGTLNAVETTSWFGVSVESVPRTLVSLARHGRRDAIMAADAALHEQLVDAAGIAAALETAVGWPWVRHARAILALTDGRAESPLESLTRLALHDDLFPAPELQW